MDRLIQIGPRHGSRPTTVVARTPYDVAKDTLACLPSGTYATTTFSDHAGLESLEQDPRALDERYERAQAVCNKVLVEIKRTLSTVV